MRPGGTAREHRIRPLRSWGIGRARSPQRRAGAAIFLAQLPLRPLLALLTRPRWIGTENFPPQGGGIACGNHTGPLDALAYGHLLQGSGIAPRFLAKESLFRIPVLGALLRATGQVPVHRGTARGQDALASAREALHRDEIMMVFPEGTYTRDPELWPMQGKHGAARLALATGVPLIPIACWGSRRLWPVGRALPRPGRGRIIMRVGEPLTAARAEGESESVAAQRLTAELMAAIAALLAETRGSEPPATLHDPRQDPVRPERGGKLTTAELHRLRDDAAAAIARALSADQAGSRAPAGSSVTAGSRAPTGSATWTAAPATDHRPSGGAS
jgi:1-acyl-sn-glycerol-3-phosphate acyltransferase